jgi:multicomponent Na+:H+ antiporter subunit G
MTLVLEYATAALLVVGAVFNLLAAVGLLRLPDAYTRMSSSSKAATLGVSCALLAGGIHFHQNGITQRALAMIVFFLLTAPVAAHMIGRAAWLSRVPFWEGTRVNELEQRQRSQPVASPNRRD